MVVFLLMHRHSRDVLMKGILAIALAVFITAPIITTSATKAQRCGQGFDQFIVIDKKGKGVPNVTFELVAQVPLDFYLDLKKKTGRNNLVYSEIFGLSPAEAEAVSKRTSPLERDADLCGNPLKQQAGETKVKRLGPPHVDEPSTENFGLCTSENGSVIYLLKISAPGYVTDYYVSGFLTGCERHSAIFVLKKGEEEVKRLNESIAAASSCGDAQQRHAAERETASLLSSMVGRAR